MKLLPSPGRALVTSSKLEKPGSAPGPKAVRRIWRCTRRNSSEIRVRVRDQSTMPARSRDTASTDAGPNSKEAAGSAERSSTRAGVPGVGRDVAPEGGTNGSVGLCPSLLPEGRSRSTTAEADGAWVTVIPSSLLDAFGSLDGGGANKEDFSGCAAFGRVGLTKKLGRRSVQAAGLRQAFGNAFDQMGCLGCQHRPPASPDGC